MQDAFDEMTAEDGRVRDAYAGVARWLDGLPEGRLARRSAEAEALFRRLGITFLVHGREEDRERLIPFDVIPRVFTAAEWGLLARGLVQRVRALNMFLHDIYHDAEIVRAGRIPPAEVFANPRYQVQMHRSPPPGGVYVHVAGVDVVRVGAGSFHVLEDNLRTPSGVSYMLENRSMMMRLFPDLFARHAIAPVDGYPDELLRCLRDAAPPGAVSPTVALLTPGAANAAYFEHAYLADAMGVELVEAQDLFVARGRVHMRTTDGPQPVDVIYRRTDDDFLDPLAFRPDSALGVPGLLSVVRSGRVALANALGTGVADDKSIYPYVPDIIRFYLGEEPVLQNVPTWRLRDPGDRAYVLDRLGELVVKEVHGSGGRGMLVGPASSGAERELYRARILEDPANFIAQPTLALSTCPVLAGSGTAPRHVDFRPFVLYGRDITVVPGGLTRVALAEGSLVVNSSRGGGSKDTWILEGAGPC